VRSNTERLASLLAAIAFALSCSWTHAQDETPQYGGTLNIGLVYPALAPLSWDPAAWVWKFSQDTSLVYEQLFAADLSKSRRRGGTHSFRADAWLPPDGIRGELAESWQWKEDPLRVEIHLRKGVMFPDKPGVMKSRELVAQDVVDTFDRLDRSPRKFPYFFSHVQKVEATDRHTVTFTFNEFHSDWDFRFGWGYWSGIVPHEVAQAGAGDWRNANGTGPFMLSDHVQGSAVTFTKNPVYWDHETVGGGSYKLPFVDKIVYRTIKDEATQLAALRTGKLDVLESVRWSAFDDLKQTAPQLRYVRSLSYGGNFLALRVDTKPFDDVRVRRALNMAIDKREIVSSFYGGAAELLAFPIHPDFIGYFEPLETMPDAVRDLFVYDPGRARKLLGEAGHPTGFSFKIQVCTCMPGHVELLSMIAAYLERVGVKVEIQPMEHGAFRSVLSSGTNAPGYLRFSGSSTPTSSLGKNFGSTSPFNAARYADGAFDARTSEAERERDEARRRQLVREMTREILAQAPGIWLPTPYFYTVWWPWVKNYGGELRAGAERPGPIHARMWIDQAMKKRMGH